ncbi:uncharacterized protein RSE6_12656 [Rhynchosporium secalis]|uniref:Uncharacterized protein n=1 Tax=Rhynchosporium secalis TaxID=38038 RepID=A0A1E1MRV0_RHYSE|nr:uncharacterized protein RSE6_12656 [Rhynchosporium secalis]
MPPVKDRPALSSAPVLPRLLKIKISESLQRLPWFFNTLADAGISSSLILRSAATLVFEGLAGIAKGGGLTGASILGVSVDIIWPNITKTYHILMSLHQWIAAFELLKNNAKFIHLDRIQKKANITLEVQLKDTLVDEARSSAQDEMVFDD